jgi:MraZ protein
MRDGFDGLYCYPSFDRPALDAGGNALLQEIEALIARYSPYSEEREQFSAALYSTSEILKIDGEGRVVLPESLKAHAQIADAVAFAGLGHKFQIWEPDRFRAELEEATEKVRTWKKQLGSRSAAEGPHGARE